ncbi:uncharacterized protein LOC113278152 [Papaver somniferum]|uniref:uncharacterized protein LOC113278152 n=1 Tax=Papaver somniferum TaxID=3469 RepID=UPI000E7056A9|nr:uncharacterized protein LOC113278152 [Papaver somniferum]
MEAASVKNPPPPQTQPWRISIRAKAFKNFDLTIVASSTFLSSFRIDTTQFSILVKIRKFFLKVESEPVVMKKNKRNSFKSKFLKLLGKLRPKSLKKFVPDIKKIDSDYSKPQIGFPSSPLNRGRMKKELGDSRNVFDLIPRWVSVTNDVRGGGIIIYISKRLIYISILLLVLSFTIYSYSYCSPTAKFFISLLMSWWRRLIISWWRWCVSSDFVRNILSSIGGALM